MAIKKAKYENLWPKWKIEQWGLDESVPKAWGERRRGTVEPYPGAREYFEKIYWGKAQSK